MAEKNAFEQLSWRLATRSQSFSRRNMISARL
jgi:hypothetical protein